MEEIRTGNDHYKDGYDYTRFGLQRKRNVTNNPILCRRAPGRIVRGVEVKDSRRRGRRNKRAC